MQELLVAVARGLVENKDAVAVTVDDPREDGTIAKAIRIVMRAAAVRQGEKAIVEID